MFKRFEKRFISWLYRSLDQERKRIQSELIAKNTAEIDASQRAHAAVILRNKKERENTCRHLKGGRLGLITHKDYAISQHTFCDGSTVARCFICGKSWSKAEGNWEEAEFMLDSTTNRPSSSEQVFKITDRDFPEDTRTQPQEEDKGPFAPFVTSGYIKLWERAEKKLKRLKAKVKS